MKTMLTLRSIYLALLSISNFASATHLTQSLVRRQTAGCNDACQPLFDADNSCANSTDAFCGCTTFISFGAACTACFLVNDQLSASAVPNTEVTRAFCLCHSSCGYVAPAFWNGGFNITAPENACLAIAADQENCIDCIQDQDPFAALMLASAFQQACVTSDVRPPCHASWSNVQGSNRTKEN
jgi:hypothetical protein